MSEDKTQDTVEEEKVGPGAYIALLAALVFFSGIFYKIDGYKWLGALDFTTLAGAFGQISGKTLSVPAVSAHARAFCLPCRLCPP